VLPSGDDGVTFEIETFLKVLLEPVLLLNLNRPLLLKLYADLH